LELAGWFPGRRREFRQRSSRQGREGSSRTGTAQAVSPTRGDRRKIWRRRISKVDLAQVGNDRANTARSRTHQGIVVSRRAAGTPAPPWPARAAGSGRSPGPWFSTTTVAPSFGRALRPAPAPRHRRAPPGRRGGNDTNQNGWAGPGELSRPRRGFSRGHGRSQNRGTLRPAPRDIAYTGSADHRHG